MDCFEKGPCASGLSGGCGGSGPGAVTEIRVVSSVTSHSSPIRACGFRHRTKDNTQQDRISEGGKPYEDGWTDCCVVEMRPHHSAALGGQTRKDGRVSPLLADRTPLSSLETQGTQQCHSGEVNILRCWIFGLKPTGSSLPQAAVTLHEG